jgi:hypothetical protein
MGRPSLVLAVAVAAVAAPPATAAWTEPAPPPRWEAGRDARQLSLAVVGGVPYAAWTERDADNSHIRVARLQGGVWAQVGIPRTCAIVFLTCSPLNRDDDADAINPAIADVGGRPHVAWMERDAVNWEVRVARLTDAGTWERIADGPSPLNLSPTADSRSIRIAGAGGVPYVSWLESNAGNSNDVHVARLGPGGTWQRIGDGVPGRVDGVQVAQDPELAVIDGVPHVSWFSSTAVIDQTRIFVARLDAAGTGWDRLPPLVGTRFATGHALAGLGGTPWIAHVDSAGGRGALRVARLAPGGAGWGAADGGAPLNATTTENAGDPRLAVVDGRVYAAWAEGPTRARIRIAVAGADGAWRRLAQGDAGLVAAEGDAAFQPALAGAGPVPLVGWTEILVPGGTAADVRVARLLPEVVSQTAVPGTGSASLFAQVQTWGLPLTAGFETGAPGAAPVATPTVDVPAGGGVVAVAQPVTGLLPGVPLAWRTLLRVGDLTVRGPDATLTPPSPPGAPPGAGAGTATPAPRAAAPPRLRCRVVRGTPRCTVAFRTTLRRGTAVRLRLVSGRRVLASAARLRVGAGGRLTVTFRVRARPVAGRYTVLVVRGAGRATVLRRVAVRAG